MSVPLKADIEHIECPMCGADKPNMLFPLNEGYRFFCGKCKHEERVFRKDDQWFWLAQRAEESVA